jgi:AcrR family transcriptional regulator
MPAQPRPYRQIARAAATEDTRRRILAAFAEALTAHWMDEITLDGIAAAAGTTRQTVLRLFGSKEGLLRAVAGHMADDVARRRAVPPGAAPRAVARAIVRDYEVSGDMVIRLLAQEGRHPDLTALLEIGRREHRQWVADALAPALAALPQAAREMLVTELVVVLDVYTWKLLRRDLGHSREATEALVAAMIRKILNEDSTP